MQFWVFGLFPPTWLAIWIVVVFCLVLSFVFDYLVSSCSGYLVCGYLDSSCSGYLFPWLCCFLLVGVFKKPYSKRIVVCFIMLFLLVVFLCVWLFGFYVFGVLVFLISWCLFVVVFDDLVFIFGVCDYLVSICLCFWLFGLYVFGVVVFLIIWFVLFWRICVSDYLGFYFVGVLVFVFII